MQHVGRIGFVPVDPVGYVFTEAAAHFRIIPAFVDFGKVLEPRFRPIAHRHHHLLLVHIEFFLLIELKQPFPRIAEPVRPFARIRILLMPDKLFGPNPALLPHRQNQLHDIDTAFAVHDLFFNIQDKSPRRLQHPQQLCRDRQKPLDVPGSGWIPP